MYILIFEDGKIKLSEEIGYGEFGAADDGVLDIVNIVDPLRPVQYIRGTTDKWQTLDMIA